MLANEKDAELIEMAKTELSEAEPKLPALEEEINWP